MRQHPALYTLRIVWFALLASTFMYLGLAVAVLAKTAQKPQVDVMLFALPVVALLVTIMSFVLPPFLYRQAANAGDLEIKGEVVPNAYPDRYREAVPKRQVFADPEAAMSKAYASFMTPFILSLALSEAVAIFGLVIVMMGFGVSMGVPYFLFGATLIAVRFPSHSKVLAMFEKVRGAFFPTSQG
jgi:hypothetical protein